MPADERIPLIDVSALLGEPCAERERIDREVMAAARTGFFVARGLPPDMPTRATDLAALLRIFELPEAAQRSLWRQKFAPGNPNVYRGWFPVQRGFLTSKEGIDLGPDVAFGASVLAADDPLREATPLPAESLLPGWQAAIAAYYRAMLALGASIMSSLARGLCLPEHYFRDAFERGLSTLRLLRYPPRTDMDEAAANDASLWVEHRGRRCYIRGAPHVDSGFLTLLAQDGVCGLQAQGANGDWIDVPPVEGTLAVNFGNTLERWTLSRIEATRHRVIGDGAVRMSVPFFYEARADAEIRPLPHDPPDSFQPFLYGDHLWATTTKFVEFKDMESLRRPLRP